MRRAAAVPLPPPPLALTAAPAPRRRSDAKRRRLALPRRAAGSAGVISVAYEDDAEEAETEEEEEEVDAEAEMMRALGLPAGFGGAPAPPPRRAMSKPKPAPPPEPPVAAKKDWRQEPEGAERAPAVGELAAGMEALLRGAEGAEGAEGAAAAASASTRRRLRRQRSQARAEAGEPPPAPDAPAAAPSGRPASVPRALEKYWLQRYSLFSRYDEGVELDDEAWYSATPEVIAWHQARRLAAAAGAHRAGGRALAVDAFAGAGGNALQLAAAGAAVVAVELEPGRARALRRNAAVYGATAAVDVLAGDFLALAPALRADAAFFSPPWGGPGYAAATRFGEAGAAAEEEEDLDPLALPRLLALAFGPMGCAAAAAWLPRNFPLAALERALRALPPAAAAAGVEVERAVLNGVLKGVTAYFGAAARPRPRRRG